MYVFDWNRNLIEDGSVGVCYGWVRGVSTLVVLIDPRERDEGGPSHIERAGGGLSFMSVRGIEPPGSNGPDTKAKSAETAATPFCQTGQEIHFFQLY